MKEIEIKIDSREKKKLDFKSYFLGKNVETRLKNKGKPPEYQYKVSIEALKFGDFLLKYEDKVYCIERKEISDYIKSLMELRLQEQLNNMLSEYGNECTILIIEGRFSKAKQWIKGATINLFMGSVLRHIRKGIKVFQVEDISQTKYAIHLLAQSLYKDPYPDRIRAKKPQTDNLEDHRNFFLAGLPQLGPKRIAEIKKNYTSIGDFILSLREVGTNDHKIYQNWKKIVWGLWDGST